MDDDVNRSSESLPTSEEFEVVGNSEPKLHIGGNKSEEQLKESLQEILSDFDGKMLDNSPNRDLSGEMKPLPDNMNVNEDNHNCIGDGISHLSFETNDKNDNASPSEVKLFMYTTSPSPLEEDLMSISTTLGDGEYTVFDRLTYLGSAVITEPSNDIEIKKNMAILNEQTVKPLQVSLSLPVNSEGSVVLYEPSSSNEISSFPILQITSHMCGDPDSKESDCLALVHGSSQNVVPETVVYQCHVFRCEVPEAVSKIVQCFQTAVKKPPKMSLSKSDSFGLEKINTESVNKTNILTYVFDAYLEFREDDLKGGYVSCPKDKDYFKLRSKLEKSVTLTVQQVSGSELVIDRCFGLLVSPGRNVRNSDMQLIEMVSFTKPTITEKPVYTILGLWDPNEPVFEILNKETPKDTRVYLTVAADLVISGIHEPVRFVIETKAKIFPSSERFWYFSKKILHEKFYLRLRKVEVDSSGEHVLQVVSVNSTSQLQHKKASLTLDLPNSNKNAMPHPSSSDEPESSTDDDEPLLSGTGEVSKDCTEMELEGWSEVLVKWRQNLAQRPRNLTSLVRRGIPEALRGEVWQLLAGCLDHKEIVDTYKSLINKDSLCDSIIQRDINRTFPANEQFKEKSGSGQESLYKICKAYSIYDPEVGYCQGLSFLVAALLLHMPEEQAFGVLVKIMFDYKVRNMFRNGFEELHIKFYQLQKLMEEKMPDLAAHFEDLGIEVHMFASQWFLTLFTAKFPLIVVFYIIDLFLLDGMDVIFQVAVALLMLSQKELLALDFEGILKHFRVSLPKKYRNEESCKMLIQNAVKVKVKKLKKYEKDYAVLKDQEKVQGDPIKALQKENKLLLESNLHLDQENDDLAHELINMKLQLRNDLVKSEEKVDLLNKELQAAAISLSELEEEKKRLSLEVAQLKEMCRRELQRAETESARSSSIITEYKQICSQLSARLEKEQAAEKENFDLVKVKLEACEECSKYLEEIVPKLQPKTVKDESKDDKESRAEEIENQTRELELELARTKLALVESECKNQDLTHQLNAALNELQTSKNTWFQKTFSTIREATKKETPGIILTQAGRRDSYNILTKENS